METQTLAEHQKQIEQVCVWLLVCVCVCVCACVCGCVSSYMWVCVCLSSCVCVWVCLCLRGFDIENQESIVNLISLRKDN